MLPRIGLLFVSLLLAIASFSLFFSLLFSTVAAFSTIFQVTIVFALPVWCLCVPVVIAVKDLEVRRVWIFFFSGSLVGPVTFGLWCLFLEFRGYSHEGIWHGDPLTGLGGISGLVFSSLVGFLTTSFYVIASKILHRWSPDSQRDAV